MAEAMYERSPEFFNKFKKNFRYFIVDNKPDLTHQSKNWAFVLHNHSTKVCSLTSPHYHVLVDTSTCPNARNILDASPYSVPCLYTCFKELLFQPNVFLRGSIMDQLKTAVEYNLLVNQSKTGKSMKPKLPAVKKSKKNRTVETQTDKLSSSTLARFEKIYNSNHFNEFAKIMDIFCDGYGAVESVCDKSIVQFSLISN